MFSVDGYFGGEWEYYIPVDDSRRRTKRDRTKRYIRQASDAGPVGGPMMPIGFRVHGWGRFQENRPGFQGAHPRIDKSGNEFERMIPPDPGELNTRVRVHQSERPGQVEQHHRKSLQDFAADDYELQGGDGVCGAFRIRLNFSMRDHIFSPYASRNARSTPERPAWKKGIEHAISEKFLAQFPQYRESFKEYFCKSDDGATFV